MSIATTTESPKVIRKIFNTQKSKFFTYEISSAPEFNDEEKKLIDSSLQALKEGREGDSARIKKLLSL